MNIRIARVWVLAAGVGLAGVSSLLGAQQTSPMGTGDASISGRVTAADTGKPIRNALVQIVIYNNLSGRFGSVLTDGDGKYEFTKLLPGEYRVAAQANRYLSMQFGQQQPGPVGLLNPASSIMLTASQAFSQANFSLQTYCAIEGSVVDEFGDPAPNVVIQVSEVQYGGGRRRLMPTNRSGDAGPVLPTDDMGHFRVGGLMPGSYYVEALSGAFADPSAAGGFGITFFPGTTEAAGAQLVTVSSGRDARISFALIPAKAATVSGRLIDAGSGSVAGGNLMLLPSERAGATLFLLVRAVADSAGRFTFRNVPPGSYTIQAYGAPVGNGGNLASLAFGYATFSVNGKDIDDLQVPIPAPRTLRGHLTFDGDLTQLPKPADVQVYARQVDFESSPIGGGPPSWKVNDDWTFEVTAMSGWRVVGALARPGWMVKKVTMNGQDVSDTPVDLREHDVSGVEIVLTTRASTVTGTAVDSDNKPLAGYSVVVFADDETKWGIWSRWVTFTRASAQGQFSLRGLPGGAYLAVVLPSVINGEWQDPEFLKRQRSNPNVVRFTLTDEGTQTIKVIGQK